MWRKLIQHGGLWAVPAAVLAWLFWTDPDAGGGSTNAMLINLASSAFALTLCYVARKIMLSYIKLEEYTKAALEKNNIAAGLVFLGVMIFMSALLLMFAPRAHAQDVHTFIPSGAQTYAPMLRAEQVRLWPTHANPAMLGALVEKESCVTLRNSRCWNPNARLKTSREEGASFGQITRAYKADGSIRFDALAATRALDPSLAEWSWGNVYRRPDLALRGIVVQERDCDRRMGALVLDPTARLAFCDAAYNGGYGGMQAERRACGQRHGCDPQRWFGQVDAVCLKSHAKMQGYGRSPCEINRDHVVDVALVRWHKYVPLMAGPV